MKLEALTVPVFGMLGCGLCQAEVRPLVKEPVEEPVEDKSKDALLKEVK